MQRRIQRPGTDVVTVSSQLLGDPGAVDLSLGGVMQDVQLDGAAIEGTHGVRLRASRPD
jgi:hypothetical protein